jgi:hypothetical protein
MLVILEISYLWPLVLAGSTLLPTLYLTTKCEIVLRHVIHTMGHVLVTKYEAYLSYSVPGTITTLKAVAEY